MCKFFLDETQTSSSKPELIESKFLQVQTLEKENKLLEENIIKSLVRRKTVEAKSTQKLQNLLMNMKKLDEIVLNLEEKNGKNELIIKKKNEMIKSLKQKFEEVLHQHEAVLGEQKKNEARIKELERELEEKKLQNQEMKDVLLCKRKISEVETEDVELLNQSFFSEFDIVRKSIRNEKKNKVLLNFSSNIEKFNLIELQSEFNIQNSEKKEDFFETTQSEMNITMSSEESLTFLKHLHETKTLKPSLFRKSFNYYQQIKLMKLKEDLGLGKLF